MQNKNSRKLFIGIMSGTSLDGIDVCIVNFEPSIEIIESHYQAYSPELLSKIRKLTSSSDNEIEQIAIAEPMLTNEYADAVAKLLSKASITTNEIQAIGVHGQTLRHIPHSKNTPGYTLQMVDPSLLAVLTEIDVVADFRRKDIALDGQGAPLVPAFHQQFFASDTEDRTIINIGGIANISFLPMEESRQTGFDTGPGNTLLDNFFQKHHIQYYDNNGNWARSGNINADLLSQFLSDQYFSQSPPKSTGPEYFNMQWLNQSLKKHSEIAAEDIQATLTELTAVSISDSVQRYCDGSKVFVCGGGTHNKFLMERLSIHLQNKISTTDVFGMEPDDVEAAAFAWLAKQRLEYLPGNLPSATGAKKTGVLGGVYLAN